MTEKLAITPQTKVVELLEAYPELEQVLFALSPKYEKLKNPLLRKTVARVATLREIAVVGGMPVGKVVNALRTAAGLAPDVCDPEAPTAGSDAGFAVPAAQTLDIRTAIERGEHPLHQVMSALENLPEGGVLELITPFVPAPLIERAGQKGWRANSVVLDAETVKTYFRKG